MRGLQASFYPEGDASSEIDEEGCAAVGFGHLAQTTSDSDMRSQLGRGVTGRVWIKIARLYVHRPWQVLGLNLILVVAMTTVLTQLETEFDMGITAFHTRGSLVAMRDTASDLAHRQLPNKPFTVAAKSKKHTNWKDRSVDGGMNGRAELHVLLSVKPGHSANLLDDKNLGKICKIAQHVTNKASWPRVCRLEQGEGAAHNRSECGNVFSVLNLYDAYTIFGLGPALDAITKLVEQFTPEIAASLLKSTCSQERAAEQLCQVPGLCLTEFCDATCKLGHNASSLDVCELVDAVQPTPAELRHVAAMPRVAADSRGCKSIHRGVMDASLRAGVALDAWASRASDDKRAQMLAVPFQLLVDRWFGEKVLGSPRGSALASNVSRLVFRLQDGARGEAARFVRQVAPELKKMGGKSVDVIWRQWDVYKDEENVQLLKDAYLAIGSFCTVFLLLWLVTGSLFITVGGMTGILLAFPVAFFYYRAMANLEWVGLLHVIGLFLILGIGADDIFVVWESWQQAPAGAEVGGDAPEEPDSLTARLAWTMQKSSGAMAATSLTTAAAFLANVVSAVCPVRLFGAFMALLVVANYCLVVTWFPCILIIHHRCLRLLTWRVLARRACLFPSTLYNWIVGPATQPPHTFELLDPSECKDDAASLPFCDRAPACAQDVKSPGEGKGLPNTLLVEQAPEVDTPDSAPLVSTNHAEGSHTVAAHSEGCCFKFRHFQPIRVLRTLLAESMPPYIVKWRFLIAMLSLGLSACMGTLAIKMHEPAQRESMWPKWHRQYRYMDVEQQFAYGREARTVHMAFHIGLAPEKLRECGDVNNPTSEYKCDVPLDDGFQIQTVEEQEWILEVCNALRHPSEELLRHMMQRGSPCFLLEMDEWLRNEKGVHLPLPSVDFQKYFLEFQDNLKVGTRFVNYSSTVAEASFGFTSNLAEFSAPDDILFEWQFWEDWLQNRTRNAPPSMQSIFCTSSWFRFAETFQELNKSAVGSLGLSVLLTALVLVVSTGNFRLSMIATLCIACVAIDFLGFMRLLGWAMGIIESICCTVLVGLSVDYIVHIAHAYVHSKSNTRQLRMQDALQHMGVSVTCGAITTIGGSAFLIACVIVFFHKFGVFVMFTLSGAYVHAIVVFPALCAILGPDDTRPTDIIWLLRRMQGSSENLPVSNSEYELANVTPSATPCTQTVFGRGESG